MEILFLGHSAFRLKGKKATVVTDPFESEGSGFSLGSVSADIVTMSHNLEDQSVFPKITGTSRRPNPYIISAPGEYEVNGVGVFGWGSFRGKDNGSQTEKNTIYSIHLDGVRVCHLGDLGHTLSEEQVENLGLVDVLLVPVGGFFTINAEQAAEVVASIQPSHVIPMHYKSDLPEGSQFRPMADVSQFLKIMGNQYKTADSLTVNAGISLDETEVVVLKAKE